jgi:DnaK suppressor protein
MASALDASSLARFRRRLEERQTQLTTLIAEGRRSDRPVSPDKAIGRLTRQDALQQQQMSAELMRRYGQELIRVQNAIRAIEGGTYGLCQRCGNPIAAARLNAMPDASLCVQCAGRPSSGRR